MRLLSTPMKRAFWFCFMWEYDVSRQVRAVRKNILTVLHHNCNTSLTYLQSQNPHNSSTITSVLLNQINQIYITFGRKICQAILAHCLRCMARGAQFTLLKQLPHNTNPHRVGQAFLQL